MAGIKRRSPGKKAMLMEAMSQDAVPQVGRGMARTRSLPFDAPHPAGKAKPPAGPANNRVRGHHRAAAKPKAPPVNRRQVKATAVNSRHKQAAMTPDPGAQIAMVPKPASARRHKLPKRRSSVV